MDRAQGWDDRIAVDPHNVVARHRFPVDAQGGGVVLQLVGGHDHRAVNDDRIGIGAVIAPGIGIAPKSIRRHRDAHHLEIAPVSGLEIFQDVIQIGLDLRPVGHSGRILTHQQGFLIEQLHVHVDMVDHIVGQIIHLDIAVDAQISLHDIIDHLLGLAGILVQNQLRREGGAEAVDHKVAPGMHQAVGIDRRFVDRQAAAQGHGSRDQVIQRAGAVVDPIDHVEAVAIFGINVPGTVIAAPDRVEGLDHEFDIIQRHPAVAEVALHAVGIAAHDINHPLFLGGVDDLAQDIGLESPGQQQTVQLLPFRHRPHRPRGRGGDRLRRDRRLVSTIQRLLRRGQVMR